MRWKLLKLSCQIIWPKSYSKRNRLFRIFPSKVIKEISLNLIFELHPGELETIKLALQIHADHILLDDLDARQVAEINIKE